MDDLSLSQSLGGLRIANNTEDDVNQESLPTPGYYDNHSPQPAFDAEGGLDVASSVGFDPMTFAAHHQAVPPPRVTNTLPESPQSASQSSLQQRPSMPLAQNAAQQSYNSGRSPDPSYHTSASSSSSWRHQQQQQQQQQPQSSQSSQSQYYSHVSSRGPTSDATRNPQSRSASYDSPGEVRRVPSKAAAGAAAAAMGMATRSPSNHSSQPPHPPRRSSRPNQFTRQDSYTLLPQSTNSSDLQYAAESTPTATPSSTPSASNEDWRDKGVAGNGSKKGSEKDAKQSGGKLVKKGVKDFNFGRTLGEGSYSTVLSAVDRQTSREYAIKVLDKKHIIKEKKVKYVNIEKDTLNRLTEHPGVVRLYYTFQDERSLYFVLDLATGGELLGVLKKTGSFDEDCTKFYAAEILDSIEYMHLRGIIHRDLKPENVLLDDTMHVKITDFGTAKILDIASKQSKFGMVSVSNDPMDGADQDRAVSFVGTAEYVSPELLTDKNACKASDLWAFGCIVYQLLAGRPPFKAGNEYQTFQKIINLEYTFPDGFPPLARDLVEKLLVLNPAERLSIAGIKSHRFFDGIEWGKGLWKQKPPKLRPHRPYTGRSETQQNRRRELSTSQARVDESIPPAIPKTREKSATTSSAPPGMGSARPMPKVITELAPPSQLDIEWSPVLNRNDERILNCGNLVVYQSPAPTSPTARNGSDAPLEAPSKFSRFFGAGGFKKRQRFVMVTSSGRIILAPSSGDKKEAKLKIELNDPDVSFRSHQDNRGYTVWCVMTRERTLTFEDPKANTGDSGSSTRATKVWTDILERAKEMGASQNLQRSYTQDPSFSGLGPRSPSSTYESTALPPDAASSSSSHRNMLRKQGMSPAADDDSMKRGKRFSKRNSKNGLAAVF